mmetsp:Transcript_98/g.196  ORF Transcript_98/g.196 Transcript_98/m.196 type:complete len:410 (+) Transcript_98:695-1924(+)
MGVKMLFYPIEYMGTKWYREDDCTPYGLLGWQGVVPARTEKMAGRLVQIVTAKLLSLGEAFGRIEAKEFALLMVDPVSESLKEHSGNYWSHVLTPFLPLVLERVVSALQGEIEDVLDLRQVVLSAFVRDKIVLVDLFQKVGKVELDFLVESGFGFGFLLGLGQMALWVAKPKIWTLPVAGALVGYVTNWIAIKLLFEPAEPVEVIGPFVLQGLFESRQLEVSDEFAHFMEKRVLSSTRLLGALSVDDEEKLFAFLRRQLPFPIPSHVLQSAIKAIQTIAANPKKYPELHAYVTERLDIEDTLSRRLKRLSPTEFEDLLHPVFQEDEIILIVVGGILGAAAGLAQMRLGWGGPGAKLKAAATIVFCLTTSSLFFLLKDVGVKKIEEEVEEVLGPRPKLRRRNTLVRVETA